MSAKCLDKQGRWRNKTVAFRVSPEEDELLETAVTIIRSDQTGLYYPKIAGKRGCSDRKSESV